MTNKKFPIENATGEFRTDAQGDGKQGAINNLLELMDCECHRNTEKEYRLEREGKIIGYLTIEVQAYAAWNPYYTHLINYTIEKI